MANKGRFHIPSTTEMEEDVVKLPGPQPSSLFNAHRKTLQDNISKEKNKTPPKKQHCDTLPDSNAVQKTVCNDKVLERLNPKTGASNLGVQPTKTSPRICASTALSTKNSPHAATASTAPKTESENATDKDEETDDVGAAKKDGQQRPTNVHALIVSARQRGNPILKYVRNVPIEFGDIVADYQMGQTTCALYLSLRYHNLNPNYIHERLKQLGHTYILRVLLVQVDIKDPTHCLKELAKMCILADCTLILAFSPEEAGKYLETYKSFENKPPELIMEKAEGNYLSRVTDTLTAVRSVNKTDASTLLHTFGNLKRIVEASEEDLSFCPGFGPQKAKRLHTIFHEPFLKEKKKGFESPNKKSTESTKPKS